MLLHSCSQSGKHGFIVLLTQSRGPMGVVNTDKIEIFGHTYTFSLQPNHIYDHPVNSHTFV